MSDDLTTGTLPLTGLRVLDLCTGPGATASRYLADLGADVIVVDGDGSAPGGTPSETIPAAFMRAAKHANKRSIALDLAPDGADFTTFWELAGTCDIVFEDSAPGSSTNPVSARNLHTRLPHAVVVAITDFGQSGPYRDWVGTEAVHSALSSELSRSGLPGQVPLLPPARIATESAAVQAAWAALLAHMQRLNTGRGQLVDASMLELISQTLDPAWGMGGSATGGKPAADGPRGRPDSRHLYPIFSCKDGYVRLCILAPRQWQGMFRWLGEPEDLADPALALLPNRFAAKDRIYPAIQALFDQRSRAEIVTEGQLYGVPSAALLEPAEVFEADQFIARDAFREVRVGDHTAVLPNGMVEVDGARAGLRQPAPTPDADRDQVLSELTSGTVTVRTAAAAASTVPGGPTGSSQLPLTGVRVLDLGVIVAGAEAGRLLGDMGAEVIKVENRAFLDGGRQSMTGEPISLGFAWGNRNKLGLGLDLRSQEGLTIFKELVAVSDVVLSNFKPGTMDSLGLSYEVLADINPRIVVADSSAYGPTGPWSRRMGYGPLVRCETGLSGLWRQPGTDDGFSDAATVYPDHTAARVEVIAVLALLLRRRTTGRGGRVSVAQAEVILAELAAEFAWESVQPGSLRPTGNARPGDAPRGVFPCAGDDEWVVVDVRDNDDFTRLARVTGHYEWLEDVRFNDPASREAHRDLLDAALAQWTSDWTPKQAASVLQAAGVPAGMMLRPIDLVENPHFAERRFFGSLIHPLIEAAAPTENHPAVFEDIADPPLAPAPLLGEHSRSVLARVLGYDGVRIDDLIGAGIVEVPTEATSGFNSVPASGSAADARADQPSPAR